MYTAIPLFAARRKNKGTGSNTAQLSLFDGYSAATGPRPAPVPLCPTSERPPCLGSAGHAARPLQSKREDIRTLTVDDMPQYSPQLIETVDRMLAELKNEHLLMTYRTIRECFNISRATVARRVKDGLVPGVRMVNGRVLEEGPVRRFDRVQVRWLLLAILDGGRNSPSPVNRAWLPQPTSCGASAPSRSK